MAGPRGRLKRAAPAFWGTRTNVTPRVKLSLALILQSLYSRNMATGNPLDKKTLKLLRALVDDVGEKKAVETLGLPLETCARAAAGFGVRAATAEVIRIRLVGKE